MIEEWLVAAATAPWLPVALLCLVVLDAFLVVLPSETAVVALAALWASTGAPDLVTVALVAAVGAVIGDTATYALGRSIGTERWRWQRRPRVARAIDRARRGIHRRAAVLIMTARYVPYARVAMNLSAGATGFAYRRFLPLSMLAGVTWALYNCGVGALFGAWLGDSPLLAVLLSVVCAVTLGLAVDAAVRRMSREQLTLPTSDA